VALVTLMGVFWFEIPFQGSVAVLFIGTLAFLLSSVGLGLLISTTCSTQQQAVMAGTFVLTPAILLSGLIFPIANMAVIFQYITYVNPLRYFIVIVQGVFLGGRSLAAGGGFSGPQHHPLPRPSGLIPNHQPPAISL
jgi:ABC-2 type transport system permease protein